jgi:hypothetical protein
MTETKGKWEPPPTLEEQGFVMMHFPNGAMDTQQCALSRNCPHHRRLDTAHCPKCEQDYDTGPFYCSYFLSHIFHTKAPAPTGCPLSGIDPQKFDDALKVLQVEYKKAADKDYEQWRKGQ